MLARRSVIGFVVLTLIISLPAILKAQNVASITGVVTDQTGAVVPDVDVTLQNPETGVTYKATTNATGSYTLNQRRSRYGSNCAHGLQRRHLLDSI